MIGTMMSGAAMSARGKTPCRVLDVFAGGFERVWSWVSAIGPLHRVAILSAMAIVSPAVREEAAASRPDAASAARFQDVVLPHLDAAHNLARYLSGDAHAAEDIVQEAFLRAFRGFGEFRGGSARAWILAIVRNCHLNWRVEQRRRRNIEPLDSAPMAEGLAGDDAAIMERPDLPKDEITPETILFQRAEASEVRLVLAGLPEAFREILVLRELEDLSYREISEVTTMPMGTVMSRLARARALFAAAWKRRLEAGKGAL
jgi:RNA polymerase sigma factor (sigma-70 family)